MSFSPGGVFFSGDEIVDGDARVGSGEHENEQEANQPNDFSVKSLRRFLAGSEIIGSVSLSYQMSVDPNSQFDCCW